MRKGLQGKTNRFNLYIFRVLIVLAAFFVSFNVTGQDTFNAQVCSDGVLYGTDLFTQANNSVSGNPIPIPTGQQSGGYWSSPDGLVFADPEEGGTLVSGFGDTAGATFDAVWTRNNGKEYFFEITVSSNTAPNAELLNENGNTEGVVLCSGDNHTFEAIPSGAANYEFFEENRDTGEETLVQDNGSRYYNFSAPGDGSVYEVYTVITDNSGICRSISNSIQASDIADVEVEVVGGASACQTDITGLELEVLPYSSDFSYEWYQDGSVAGETGPTYAVTAEGNYYVEVTGPCSPTVTDTSNTVAVGTYELPEPLIDPSGTLYLCLDQDEINFSSSLTGPDPTGGNLVYEWRHNNQIKQTGTNTSYTNNTTLSTVILGDYQLILREDGNEECYQESPITDVAGRTTFEVVSFSAVGSPSCETSTEPQFDIELNVSNGTPPYRVVVENLENGTTQTISSLSNGTNTISWGSDINTTSDFRINNVSDAAGCEIDPALMPSSTVTFEIDPINIYDVTGTDICNDGSNTTSIGLNYSELGVDYSLFRDGSQIAGPVAGSAGVLTFGDYDVAGEYTVEATKTGCPGETMNGSVTISAAPDYSLSVNMSSGTGCSGTTHVISVANPETDVLYSLYRDGVEVRSPRTETGPTLDFGGVTSAGQYQVFAERGACSDFLTDEQTINKTPDAQSYVDDEACEGEYLYVELQGSEVGFDYHLYDGAAGTGSNLQTISGNGGAISFPSPISGGGTYSVIASNPGTSCTRILDDITIHDEPDLTPILTTTSSPVCAGTNHTLTLSDSQNDVYYRLYRDDITGTRVDAQWGEGGAIDFLPQSEPGTYLVTADNNGCEYQLPDAELVINKQPEVYTISGSDACEGEDVTITVDDSETEVSYVLYRNGSSVGSAVGGTGGAFDFSAQYSAGTYTVIANAGGCEAVMDGDVVVNPLPTVSVNNLGDHYCAGAGNVSISGSPVTGTSSWTVQGSVPSWFSSTGNTATFNVDDALDDSGEGSYTFTYTYEDPGTGCVDQASESTYFHDDINDNIDFRYRDEGSSDPWSNFPAAGDLILCQDDDPIELEGFFTDAPYDAITEGDFSGPGIDNGTGNDGEGVFDPSVAGNGNHTITFTYTDMYGCTGTIDYTIQIGTTLTFNNLNDFYCPVDDPSSPQYPVTISATPNDPALTQGGTLNLYDNGAIDPGNLILSESTSGSDPEIDFHPENLGPDTYYFEYIYDYGGCENIIVQEVVVPAEVDASFSIDPNPAPDQFCVNYSGGVDLVPDMNVGTFSGPGVSGNRFFPADAGLGDHQVTHTINTGGCYSSETLTISVIDTTDVGIVNLASSYCNNQGEEIISANVSGGTYDYSIFPAAGAPALNHLDASDHTATFNPSLIPADTYYITLVYVDPVSNCTSTLVEEVEVNAVNSVDFADNQPGPDMEYCMNGGPVEFTASFSESPSAIGTFTIDTTTGSELTDGGDNTATLDPSLLSPGTYQVTFTYINSNGCEDSETKTITILPSPVDSFTVGGGGNYCVGGTGVEITLNGSQSGVEYELLLNAMSFSPQVIEPGDGNAISFGTHAGEGTYTVVGTNTSSGCQAIMDGSVDVAINEVFLDVDATSDVSCNTGSDGSITLAASGGSGNYVYSIVSGPIIRPDQNSDTFDNLPAGTYTARATDDIGCYDEYANIEINEPTDAVTLTEQSNQPVDCYGNSTGSVVVEASGGSGGYEFSIDGGATWLDNGTPSYEFENLAAGTYTVDVEDAAGCTESISVTISEPSSAFTLSVSETNSISCFDGNDGELTVDGNGGVSSSGVNYVLYEGGVIQQTADNLNGDPEQFTGLDAGNYRVVAWDDNGCNAEELITIDQPATEISITVEDVTDATTVDGNEGSIEISIAGGSGSYPSVIWDGTDEDSNPVTGLTDDVYIQNGLVAGTYTVEVTDGNGCTVLSDPIPVSDPDSQLELIVSVTEPGPCNGATDGTISITANGGVEPYQSVTLERGGTPLVSFSSGSDYAHFENLGEGTYVAEVEDDAGNVESQTIEFDLPDALSIDDFIINRDATCVNESDGSVTFSVSGGTPDNSATPDFYNYYIIPQSGAVISGTVGVGLDETVSTLAAGSDYKLQIVDAEGCDVETTFDIEEPDPVTFDISSENLSCFESDDGQISVTNVNGGWGSVYIYDWYIYNEGTSTWDNYSLDGPSSVSGLETGRYRVTVRGGLNNCSATSAPVIITEPEALELKLIDSKNITSCFGNAEGEVSLRAEGGTADYDLTGSAVNLNWSGTNTFTAGNLSAGTHNFNLEDDNGCTDNISVTIEQPEPLVVSNVAYNIGCDNDGTGGTVDLEVEGGRELAGEYSYNVDVINQTTGNTWDVNYSFPSSDPAPYAIPTISGIPAGDYVLIVSDANSTDTTSCSYNETFSLEHIEINETITSANCAGADNGGIDITITGGSGDYSFIWTKDGDGSFSRSTEDLGSVTAGTYNLNLEDNIRGCVVNRTYTVDNEHTLSISGTEKDVTCNGANNGAVLNVSVSDPSSAVLDYEWTGGTLATPVTTEELIDVGQGTYQLEVTDGNGCVVSRNFNVEEPDPISFDLSTSLEDCDPYSRSITLDNLSGGTGDFSGFSFSWTGPGNTTDAQNQIGLSEGGEYTVVVRDANGNCPTSQSIVIPGEVTIDQTVSHLDCFGDNNGSIVLHLTGGSGDFDYVWTTTDGSGHVANDKDQTGLTAGTYTVEITDNQEGCTVTKDITINQPPQLTITGDRTHIVCAGNDDGAITLDVVGGTGDYVYSWSSGNGNGLVDGQKDQTGLTGGTYAVTVTDDNNCTASRNFTIDEPDPLSFDLDITPSNCLEENFVEIVNQSGGSGSYEYTWGGPGVTTGTGITSQTNLPGGEYSVTMTDVGVGVGQQCQETQTFELTKPLSVSYTVQPETCSGSNDGSIDITPDDGVAPYTYSWTTTDGSGLSVNEQDQSGLTAGTYEVTITDSNPDGSGCAETLEIEVGTANALSISGSVTNVRCFGGTSGAVNDVTVTGGSGSYSYNWIGPNGFTATTANIDNLEAGSYTLEVSDNLSGVTCYVSRIFTVDEPVDSMEVTNVDVTPVDCRGAATGAIDITVNGGTTPYTYQWTGAGTISDPTSEDIIDLRSGDFNVVITDANGCELDYENVYGSFINVPQPSESLNVDLVNYEDVTTFNGNNGSIEVDVTGGTGAYTILWFDENDDPVPGSTGNEIIDNLEAGTYRVHVEDGNGCEDEVTDIIIRQPDDDLQLLINKRNVGTCNGADNGRIQVDMIGGTLPYQSITLNNSSGQVNQVLNDNNAVFTGLSAGEYEVVGVDDNGEEVRQDITIIQPDGLNLSANVTTHVECYSDHTGQIEISATGGVASSTGDSYYVTLSGGPSGTATNYSPATGEVFTFDDLPAGTYTVRVIDDSNVNLVAGNVDDMNLAYGDGAYNLADDCVVEEEITINQPEAELEISVLSAGSELCEGELPTLQIITSDWDVAANPLQVELSDGETYIVDSSPFQFQPVDAPAIGITQYTIAGFVEQGTTCNKGTSSGMATVEVHPLPTATIFGDGEVCYGESADMGVELTGTGPWDVEISDGSNNWNETYTNTFNIFSHSPLADATYEILSVTDSYCSNSGTGNANITVNELPQVTLSGDAEICEGGDTDLTFEFTHGVGPWTVTFTENGTERTIGPVNTATHTLSVSPDTTTDYELVDVKDANGCEQPVNGEARVTVREWPERPSAINGDDIVCQGSTHTYSVSAVPNATGYDWSLPTGATIVSGVGTREIEVQYAADAQPGNITVFGVNSCGDGPVRSLYINVDQLPQNISPINGETDLCQGSTGISYSVTPETDASSYNWTVPTGFSIVSGQGSANITVDLDSDLDATIGDITVTPENGCGISTSSSVLEVEVHPLPEANAGGDQQLCDNTAVLNADDPSAVDSDWSGQWEVVPGGSANVADVTNPNSDVTDISRGDVVLRWVVTNTVTGPGCSVSDEVTLRNNELTVYADADETLTCDGSSEIFGKPIPPLSNTSGLWTVESGSGSFDDAGSDTTTVYDLGPGENILRWTITQNGCDSYAEVIITNDMTDQALIDGQPLVDLCGDATSLIANDPVEGTGSWTVEKGSATITPGPDSYQIDLTNLSKGENILRWTIEKGSCSTYDEVTIRNNTLNVDAGNDTTTCDDFVQLNGTEPPTGVDGQWTALGDAQGEVSFANGNIYNTEITGLIHGDNELVWTLEKNGCLSSDSVVVTSNKPTTATVGADQFICRTDTVLSGNAYESYESGKWSIIQGSGNFEDDSDPNSRVTGIGQGTNIYRWSIFSESCSSSADLTIVNNKTDVFAGKDTVVCSRNVTLNADPLLPGYTGEWTVVGGSGGVTFGEGGDKYDPKGNVRLDYDVNGLIWTVSHTASGCMSADTVSILVNEPNPNEVDAGDDDEITGGSSEYWLNAVEPTRGSGRWTLVSGGGDIIDPTNPTSKVENLRAGPNKFRWTVTIGNCYATDSVIITNGEVIDANAGPDITVCSSEASLSANDPDVAIGEWSVVSGSGRFEDRFDPNTIVYDLGTQGDNVFRWTISYGPGTSSSTDEVTVINNEPDEAKAGLDNTICGDTDMLEGNTPDANMGTVSWKVISGSGIIVNDDQPVTEVNSMSQGDNVFVYTIEKGTAPDVCYSVDTVVITNGIASEADAGYDDVICTDSVQLDPNVPNHGTGEWRVVEGDADFEGNWAKNIAPGRNLFEWFVSTGLCDSSDTVEIINNRPTEARAGRDRAVCSPVVELSGSADVYGDGEWVLISGYGDIDDPSDPNTEVTNLSKGSNRFRWTITNGDCSDSDDVEISYDMIEADAGESQIACADTAVLNANNPSPGIGTWGVLDDSGSAEFDDLEDPYTIVRGLDRGDNILTWTITNGECVDTSYVTITNNKPSTAEAGGDKSRCDNFIRLAAKTPTVGEGRWTIRNGSGQFSSPSGTYADGRDDPNARVDSLKFGANIFRWTIENEGCISYDDVQIDYNTIQATVGEERTICSDTETLQGNNPDPGKGTWTVVGGSSQAVFDDSHDPNTTVHNLRKGSNQLRWTIDYKGCQTYEEVTINNDLPSEANAGNTQRLCDNETTLDADPPATGVGTWEVISGSATIDDADINDPKAPVTNLAKGENVLRWTVENGICRTEDVVMIVNNSPSQPNAGGDLEVCEPNHDLKAVTPEYGDGFWSIVEGGGYFSDVEDPRTEIQNLSPGRNVLKWTVSQGQCTLSDEIVIENNTPTTANAGPDVADCKDWAELDANPAMHGEGEWFIVSGRGDFVNPSDEITTIENLGFGKNKLMWEIRNGETCFSRDTVTIFNKLPEKSDAGRDKILCQNYTTLNGNPPGEAVGTWSVVSGAGEFEDPNAYNSLVEDIGFGDNLYKWTVAYEDCVTESTVTIRSNKTDAYAGEDVVVYDPEVILNANNVGELDASWSVVGGAGEFEDPTFFNTLVDSLREGVNTYRWTIDVDGCISYDDVSVEYRPVPDAGFITNVDEGCWPLTVDFTNYTVGAQERDYMWSFGDGDSSDVQNPVHTYESAGDYPVELIVPGPDGITGRYQKIIRVYEHPEANFSVTPEEVYVPGDEVRFFDLSVDAIEYKWDFDDGNTSDEPHPSHEYTEDGVYDVMLHVTNEYGCVDSMMIYGAVTAYSSGFIKFPNAFKPRPDGSVSERGSETNNIFKPVYRDVDTYHLQIFNRWGQLIYESYDIDEGWDGIYKGQLAPQAVYVWKVNGTFINGREYRETGSVLLVR